MRRLLIIIIMGLFLIIQTGGVSAQAKKRKIKPPKECRTTKYTCVLKKHDGVPFYCVRTAKQRYQNAKRKIRIVSKRNCIRRYPVEYVDEEPTQKSD